MVRDPSKAFLYFTIGYVIAVGLSAILYPLPAGLKAIIVFTFVQLVFAELHLLYLTKSNCNPDESLLEVIKVGILWAGLSFVFDILLFVLVIPLVLTGVTDFAFFNTQPTWYWFQFPMLVITGFVGRATFVKIVEIRREALRKEELWVP